MMSLKFNEKAVKANDGLDTDAADDAEFTQEQQKIGNTVQHCGPVTTNVIAPSKYFFKYQRNI